MTIINPYQKGAVKSSDKFFGYKKQRQEMEKLITQSKITGERCNNMVFIGEPSTGKSSFLNITDEYCANAGYLTCHINLSIEISCYEFFKEIFISVLTAISEKTESNAAKSALRTYRSMINTGVGQLDFHFPQEYFYWAQRERSFDEYPSISNTFSNSLIPS